MNASVGKYPTLFLSVGDKYRMLVSELERFRMDPQQTYVTGTIPRQAPALVSNIPRYPNLAVYQIRSGETLFVLGVTVTRGSRRKLIASLSFDTHQSRKFFWPVDGFDVIFSKVIPDYQGQGIGLAVYRELILQLKWNLYATGSHSRGGEKLWQRLSQTPGIVVYALQQPDVVVKPPLTAQGLRLPNGEDFYLAVDQNPWSLIAVAEDGPSDNALKKLMKNA